ncbi:MAG TPA: FkbM family methyltransferase [Pyrinomonadaceae bacterium]|nr:FkbM family methyltransferase [Pyrinomonadaceae bacterium]
MRASLYGYTSSRADVNFKIVPGSGGPSVIINDSAKIRITPEALDDFSYHFRTNGASIEEMDGFIRMAKDKKLFFDVGAHKGLFSLVFCACNPNGSVVGYEPSQVLRNAAERLSTMNNFGDRIRFESDVIGQNRQQIPASVDSSGFIDLAPQFPDLDHMVQMTTLDDECERLGVFPDIVKIDIEGYEYEALKGAPRMLSKRPVLCLEMHLDMLERRGLSPKEICDDLLSNGYKFYTCLGSDLSPREVYDSAMAVLRFIAR